MLLSSRGRRYYAAEVNEVGFAVFWGAQSRWPNTFSDIFLSTSLVIKKKKKKLVLLMEKYGGILCECVCVCAQFDTNMF